MIRSTVPANSLTENPAATRQGGVATQPPSSGSNIRTIQGGSRMQTPSQSPLSDVRTYTNGNSGRQGLRPDQLRQADSRSVSGSPAVAPPQSPSVPTSEGPTARERVYRIYGSQSEGAKSNGSPASPPRDLTAPRNANAVPYNPPSRNTPVVPSAPPSRFQATPESPSVPRSTTAEPGAATTNPSAPSVSSTVAIFNGCIGRQYSRKQIGSTRKNRPVGGFKFRSKQPRAPALLKRWYL